MTGPADIPSRLIARAVAEYQKECPEVRVEIHLTNRYVDLIAEGFELAVRGGT